MGQSLTRLPKTADFEIRGVVIQIRDHKCNSYWGLWGKIIDFIEYSETDKEHLRQFEKHGISFETVIEECVHEMEHDADILANFINLYYSARFIKSEMERRKRTYAFSKSDAGRRIAGQVIERIRSCDNWDELYDEFKRTGKFRTEMGHIIESELKQ